MREININGYIDEEEWWGDEITPQALRGVLHGANNEYTDDVHIRLCSYGGSCNAATRMYDDIRAYPGQVMITVSGTAASAATVLATAADRLEMTPGSLYMIHDPSVFAWGNERDLTEAVNLLKACKESILNVYGKRCAKPREEVAAMMAAATWMDARQALADGFIDGITEDAWSTDPTNAAQPRTANRKEAEAKVRAWLERQKPNPRLPNAIHGGGQDMEVTQEPPAAVSDSRVKTPTEPTANPQAPDQEPPGTSIAQLEHRLGLIMPTRR